MVFQENGPLNGLDPNLAISAETSEPEGFNSSRSVRYVYYSKCVADMFG